MNIKGTKTEQNLMDAFAGESAARNKYTYYAAKARSEGYSQIAKIFEETADNEKEHARIWFELLQGGEVGPTASNLLDAAKSERYEWTEMYDAMAREAEEEGFFGMAQRFRAAGDIEKDHEERFLDLLRDIEEK